MEIEYRNAIRQKNITEFFTGLNHSHLYMLIYLPLYYLCKYDLRDGQMTGTDVERIVINILGG